MNYIVISRERAARIAAETMLVEERKRVDQLVQQFAETQRQAVENERQAAENQQAILSTLADLTAELIELRRQRNGENGS